MSWRHSAKSVVLIVEDDTMVRSLAIEMVQEAGFEVIAAVNADDAIRILENNSDIGVVFTDIQMPGSMDGLKLAHAVRNRWPPIKIIVTSAQRMATGNELPEGGRFLAKPYSSAQIRGVLRESGGAGGSVRF
jgi:CheY-like chemotaxis protein